jgi:hypothetical protein
MGSAEECALVGTLYMIGCVCESTGRRSQKREEETEEEIEELFWREAVKRSTPFCTG